MAKKKLTAGNFTELPASVTNLLTKPAKFSPPVNAGIIPMVQAVEEDETPAPAEPRRPDTNDRLPTPHPTGNPMQLADGTPIKFMTHAEVLQKRSDNVLLSVQRALQAFQDDILNELTHNPETPDYFFVFDEIYSEDMIQMVIQEVKRSGWQVNYDTELRKLTFDLPEVRLLGTAEKIQMRPRAGL